MKRRTKSDKVEFNGIPTCTYFIESMRVLERPHAQIIYSIEKSLFIFRDYDELVLISRNSFQTYLSSAYFSS